MGNNALPRTGSDNLQEEFRMMLVTGGAGFIGANFVHGQVARENASLVNLDKLTYAGNLYSLAEIKGDPRHLFVQGDVADRDLLKHLLQHHRPSAIVHFAAESHVDRSIHSPGDFIHTNVIGTFHMLDETLAYWRDLAPTERSAFRLLHISTDEVYGSLNPADPAFNEHSAYAPNSPYSASKAAADHLVRSYHHTYGLPTLTTNCSNNYGPYQFPEKLIPLMILNALQGKALPLYGDGLQVRDWLYVSDHCAALRAVLDGGQPGATYVIGGRSEKTNLELVRTLCAILDELRPDSPHRPHAALIRFVTDRPGHDRRYAIDARKIEQELGWRAQESFESGLRKTVQWYLDHPGWVEKVTSGAYRRWVDLNYESREALC